MATSMVYRLPPAGFVPDSAKEDQAQRGPSPDVVVVSEPQLTEHSVSVSDATRSKQFWLMWTGFGFAITGRCVGLRQRVRHAAGSRMVVVCSYGIISCGKTLLSEAFTSTMPDVVTAGFSATFVAAMSAANLGGRVFWSNASDIIGRHMGGDPFKGRKLVYSLMWGIGPPLYLGLVWSIHQAAESPSLLPLGVFCGSVCLVLSSFGGAAATRPALTGDLFGTKNVGVLTARQLSVVLPAAYVLHIGGVRFGGSVAF